MYHSMILRVLVVIYTVSIASTAASLNSEYRQVLGSDRPIREASRHREPLRVEMVDRRLRDPSVGADEESKDLLDRVDRKRVRPPVDERQLNECFDDACTSRCVMDPRFTEVSGLLFHSDVCSIRYHGHG